MIDRMLPGEDGKKKTFKKNSFQNVTEFIRAFKTDLDVVGDSALEGKLKKLGAIMDGVDPEKIRSSDELRDKLRNKLESVKSELDNLVVLRPSRRYRDFGTVDES